MTTLRGAVKDSGAFDVSLKEGKQDDDNALDLQDDKRPVSKMSNKKCHQGTQTEFVSFLTVAQWFLSAWANWRHFYIAVSLM